MKVIQLDKERLESFINYCKKHKFEHDESFLSEADLKEFEIGDENPTYLLMEDAEIVGVLSLMIDDYFSKGNRSRIRIFHCEKSVLEHYEILMNSMAELPEEIHKIEMFLPNKKAIAQDIVQQLGFNYYRTSYIMVRENEPSLEMNFDEGYQLVDFDKTKDGEVYSRIRNEAFATLKGSETPMSSEMAIRQSESEDLLKGGMKILYHHNRPVGVIRMLLEDEEGPAYSFVAPIALIPEYQGKGLGRKLLKAGIIIGQENGLMNSMLCVNAENEMALNLYKKEGYKLDMAVSCFVKAVR